MNDLLKLIGSDCRWLWFVLGFFFSVKSSNTFFWITFQTMAVSSSHISHLPGRIVLKTFTRSHVWCLHSCLEARMGEDNRELLAETTVVIWVWLRKCKICRALKKCLLFLLYYTPYLLVKIRSQCNRTVTFLSNQQADGVFLAQSLY